jgi:hypothetical protein
LAKGQPVPNDSSFAFNSLLLHGNGTNGSTVITDSSGSPKTVTAFGNAQISTAQSKFGGSSIAFDGNGDYLNIPRSSQFDFGSGDFTVETWLYANTVGSVASIINTYATSPSASGFAFQREANSTISGYIYTGSTSVGATSASSISSNQWYHVAWVRNSTSLRMYLNGTGGTNISTSATVNDTNNIMQIGREGTSFQWDGYLDDLRITKGVARYTANFTPPTAPFPDF